MVGTKRNRSLFRPDAIEGATQRRDRADDHGASRHLGSLYGVKEAGRAAGTPTLSRPMLGRQAAADVTCADSDRAPVNPGEQSVERAPNREATPRGPCMHLDLGRRLTI